MLKKYLLFVIAALSFGRAYGWGQYGHEQVNSAAIEQASKSKIGMCFKQARETVLRYAITPDIEWKLKKSTPRKPAATKSTN